MSRLQLTSDGFTIIELLVAMVLFVFLMISMMTMYKESVSMNRELDATRILQKNARDVVEKIAKDIRDYGVMSTGNGFFTGEVLQIQGGKKYFRGVRNLTNTNIVGCTGTQTGCFIALEYNGAMTQITDDNVIIESLEFHTIPTQEINGVTPGREGLVQMRFRMKLKNTVGMRSGESIALNIQTTISEKIYKSSNAQ